MKVPQQGEQGVYDISKARQAEVQAADYMPIRPSGPLSAAINSSITTNSTATFPRPLASFYTSDPRLSQQHTLRLLVLKGRVALESHPE